MARGISNTTLKYSHSTKGNGRTIIQRIEIQLDKRRKKLEALRVEQGIYKPEDAPSGLWEQAVNQGRQEGLAAAIALLRSSSVAEEISRSNQRLGIE